MITYIDQNLQPDHINQVRQAVGWRALDEARYAEALQKTVYALMAYDGNRPVGLARLIGDGICYVIVDVAVDPTYQKQGIGKTLVLQLLEYVRRQLDKDQDCTILLNASYGKEDFYQKLGFQKMHTGTGMQLILSR